MLKRNMKPQESKSYIDLNEVEKEATDKLSDRRMLSSVVLSI
jgi:hypothetical protein